MAAYDSDDTDDYDDLDHSVDVYHLETMMHVAVDRCDMDMVKLLLIYGADARLVRVKTTKGGDFLQGRRGSDMNEAQRCSAMRKFCHKLKGKAAAGKLGKREEVMDVYEILERADCDDEGKKQQIRALLASENIWLPEMVEDYPVDQGKALDIMYQVLGEVMPTPVIGIVAQYYYTRTVHDERSDAEELEAQDDVDGDDDDYDDEEEDDEDEEEDY